ncbi:MAG: sugar ABC transporter permease [Oscillospiraceae bacterium]|jgi:raffinose/stachyose/melibiose transport system permease protein|nr:sugar ABC transporter permease [Oscillospiraceae bacterium]MDD4367387.1 sugar ABC transporter permease [Oscillospiraceae bacterium]
MRQVRAGVQKKSVNRKGVFIFFTLPAVFLYSFFIVYPLISGLYYSLTDWNGMSKTFHYVGLDNYHKILSDQTSLTIVGRTFGYTFLLVIICTFMAVLLALLLNRNIKGKSFFRAVYFFPAVLSSITIGLIFNQIYSNLLPVIGKTLHIPILSQSLLSNSQTAMFAILLINIWQGTALPTVLAISGLQTISNDILEAARIDGASHGQTLRYIKLPLLMPTISIIIIFNARSGLMVFDYIKATTNGGPGFSTMSIATLIYKHAFTDMRFGYSSAESTLCFLLITIFALLQLHMSRVKD